MKTRVVSAALSVAVTVAAIVVGPGPAAAQAALFGTSSGGGSSTSGLATPTGRGSTTAELTARINAMSLRPVPTSAGVPVARPDMLWVPDRYVRVPGAPDPVLVPGHWERSLPNGRVYVPPIAITHPAGEPGLIPAGERPPADQRLGP